MGLGQDLSGLWLFDRNANKWLNDELKASQAARTWTADKVVDQSIPLGDYRKNIRHGLNKYSHCSPNQTSWNIYRKSDEKGMCRLELNYQHAVISKNGYYVDRYLCIHLYELMDSLPLYYSLSLWTRNQELWTTSTYFLYGGALQDDYRPGKEYIEPSTEALVSIMIPDIFPQDLLHVPPTDILRFREKRKDERNQFLNAIKTLRNELAQADAPEVIEAIINDEKKKIDSAANEYRKSMDILRVAKFGGILTTVITVAADVLGYCSNFPDLYKGAIESSGLWAGILTGIFEKRVGNINNPYTYLAQIKSTFSYYPGASKLFGGQPQIAKYNYTLYRGFEEFIND